MLSRTADNIFWMARQVERSQGTVRLLEAAYRMEQLPESENIWEPVLFISGQKESYYKKYDELSSQNVLKFMIFDHENPSSIFSCLKSARENTRTERSILPEEMFESINTTWIESQSMYYDGILKSGFTEFFDWVKDRTELFRGLTVSMMVYDAAFQFARLGTYIERADFTARLLDVKYHLQSKGANRELIDYYQWGEVLRSVGGLHAYKMLYKQDIHPDKIAEMLIFNPIFPRSMISAYNEIITSLTELKKQSTSLNLAYQEQTFLETSNLEEVLKTRTLHKFLTDFIGFTADLSDQIRHDFMQI